MRYLSFFIGFLLLTGIATNGAKAGASLLILPSLCFEGFPMVIREAFALGVPVAASRIGALPEIVKDGVSGTLFEPGSAADLLRVVRSLWSVQDRLKKMAIESRKIFEENYTAGTNYAKLMEIYDAAIRKRRELRYRNG